MVKCMCPVKKTTIVVDEELWNRFKEFVFQMYGSSRKLSDVVEESIRTMDSVGLLLELTKLMGVSGGFPSSREIVERRPVVAELAGKILREMRDEREARLSRLERDS